MLKALHAKSAVKSESKPDEERQIEVEDSADSRAEQMSVGLL